MAPSRRKGASKAAAAAAACRQWKVGDLVLAKVKGFPAWPATVSEPEKWGYSADWKKVFVFFFGTQQIAFCNPADVEAFTEEKKESLLSKRHGKGADFGCAVQEIIDSYEELKKQEQVDGVNTIGQAALPNGFKSDECVASSGSKDEAHTLVVDSGSKLSDSKKPNHDLGIPGEDHPATTQDVFQNGDAMSEEPSGNLVVTKATTYSRKKYSGSQASIMHRRAPSARRSRSSARMESCRFQNPTVPSDSVEKNSENLSSIPLDGALRRTKRARTSTDLSDGPYKDSPLVSNGCPEESSSEIVTADSDTQSFNEGVSVQSDYKVMEPENVTECPGGDVQLSQTLEFQTKAVIVKKKRKPSRKRSITVTHEFPDRFDKQSGSGPEVNKTEPTENNDIEKSIGKNSKEDGDEHLPLVKRARVRMSRTSSSMEELDTVMEIVKPSEASNSLPGQECIVLSDGEDICAEGKLLAGGEELDQPSSSRNYTINKRPLWEANRHKHFGCLADGEAALPPSKRLHRALEAMSANVADDEHVSPEGPSMKTIINGSLSSLKDCSNLAMESNGRAEFEVQKVNSFGNIGSQVCTSGISCNLDLSTERNDTVDEVNICNQPSRASSSPEHGHCEDEVVKSVDCAEAKDSVISSPCTKTVETITVLQSPKPLSDAVERKESLLECNHTSMAPILPSKNEVEVETSDLIEPSKKDDSCVCGVSSNLVSSNMENGIVSYDDVNLPVPCSLQKSCKMADHSADKGGNDNAMLKDVEGSNNSNMEVDASPPLTIMEVLKNTGPGPELSHSTSISEDCLSHKTVSGTRISSSPTDGLDSTARPSPPTTSICNMSTLDNSNFVENNGCCSPGVPLHHEKPKHAGKWSVISEANAALTSFEVSLGTLTRTKKSIDRATRIAIDCAKFGVAVKVVEVIARSLEGEPSLHKRVDLFFLVDSIAQCSRGMKGDVGGLYPSAIQAVLPRLLLAAAPPGSSALENRRQCLKVLKLWQERKILPEPMICHHIRELDSLNNMSARIGNSRRSFRNERAFDDPVREVEGMLVDEYGSNSSIQLSDFRMPAMLKDGNEGSDSDGEGFEAVTPEHDPEIPQERDGLPTPSAEKHTHVLEDVDGELEMEDVAPSCEGETKATSNITIGRKNAGTSHHQVGQHLPSFAPPLPKDLPPSSPPLPDSPPPHPPASLPPPPPPPPPAASLHDPKLYVGPQNGNDDYPPEGRDPRMDVHVTELSGSCSFSSLPIPRPPFQATNNVHLRPPHPAPSSQFSYVQADQSWREIPPPSYPGRFHFVNSTDSGNFHSDHDRMHGAPHDESWRFPPPPFSGPCHPDGPRVPYAPNTFGGPPCEPPVSNNAWPYPPRPVNHREMAPHRPFSESPVPMATRGPNFWRPR